MSSKLQALTDTLAAHPEIKSRLDSFRSKQTPEDRELVDMVTNGLSMLSGIAMVLPIGKKGKELAALTALIGMLIELSVILKREVVDDPEIQRKVSEAWTELEAQSADIFAGARALVEKIGERVTSLKLTRG